MLLNEAKSEAKNEAKNIALTELEEKLCELLKENSKITQAEIQKELGLSKSKVQRTMKKLVNEGVIENIGSHRRGQWKVKKQALYQIYNRLIFTYRRTPLSVL